MYKCKKNYNVLYSYRASVFPLSMMSLWLNLRKSIQKQNPHKSATLKQQIQKNNSNHTNYSTKSDSDNGEREKIFSFPYGTKECIVYKQKGK